MIKTRASSCDNCSTFYKATITPREEKTATSNTKKWSISGLFRKRKKAKRTNDSSSESGLSTSLQLKKDKSEKFDYIVPLKPFTSHALNSSDSQINRKHECERANVNARAAPADNHILSMRNTNLTGSLDSYTKKQYRRRAEQRRIAQLWSAYSSDDDDATNGGSTESSSLIICKSDNDSTVSSTARKRSRAARTERYLKRLTREDENILNQEAANGLFPLKQSYLNNSSSKLIKNSGKFTSPDIQLSRKCSSYDNSINSKSNLDTTFAHKYRPASKLAENSDDFEVNRAINPPVPPPRDPRRKAYVDNYRNSLNRPMSYSFETQTHPSNFYASNHYVTSENGAYDERNDLNQSNEHNSDGNRATMHWLGANNRPLPIVLENKSYLNRYSSDTNLNQRTNDWQHCYRDNSSLKLGDPTETSFNAANNGQNCNSYNANAAITDQRNNQGNLVQSPTFNHVYNATINDVTNDGRWCNNGDANNTNYPSDDNFYEDWNWKFENVTFDNNLDSGNYSNDSYNLNHNNNMNVAGYHVNGHARYDDSVTENAYRNKGNNFPNNCLISPEEDTTKYTNSVESPGYQYHWMKNPYSENLPCEYYEYNSQSQNSAAPLDNYDYTSGLTSVKLVQEHLRPKKLSISPSTLTSSPRLGSSVDFEQQKSTSLSPFPYERFTSPLNTRTASTDSSLNKLSSSNKSLNFEEALDELDAIYNSLQLGDDELLDRAEMRDMSIYNHMVEERQRASATPTADGQYDEPNVITDDVVYRKMQQAKSPTPIIADNPVNRISYLLLSNAEFDDEVDAHLGSNGHEPNVTLDDMMYRTIKQQRSSLKTLVPQPPFGIPIGPIAPGASTDYLHVKPETLNTRGANSKPPYPDVINDDLAVRRLRRDRCNSPMLGGEGGNRHATRRKALRSLSANIFETMYPRRFNGKPLEKSYVTFSDPDFKCDKGGYYGECIWTDNRLYEGGKNGGNEDESRLSSLLIDLAKETQLTNNKLNEEIYSEFNEQVIDKCASKVIDLDKKCEYDVAIVRLADDSSDDGEMDNDENNNGAGSKGELAQVVCEELLRSVIKSAKVLKREDESAM